MKAYTVYSELGYPHRRCVVIPDAPSFFSLTIKIGSFF